MKKLADETEPQKETLSNIITNEQLQSAKALFLLKWLTMPSQKSTTDQFSLPKKLTLPSKESKSKKAAEKLLKLMVE